MCENTSPYEIVMTSVLVMQLWLHVISWRNPFFKDRVCTSKKGGIGGGGRVSARGAVHMAAALADHTKALVGTGWTISLLLTQTGVDKHPLPMNYCI